VCLKLENELGDVTPHDPARATVFGFIVRLYNPARSHSTLGLLSAMQFDQSQAVPSVHGTRDSSYLDVIYN
jgi:hypothetical protein